LPKNLANERDDAVELLSICFLHDRSFSRHHFVDVTGEIEPAFRVSRTAGRASQGFSRVTQWPFDELAGRPLTGFWHTCRKERKIPGRKLQKSRTHQHTKADRRSGFPGKRTCPGRESLISLDQVVKVRVLAPQLRKGAAQAAFAHSASFVRTSGLEAGSQSESTLAQTSR
jgi:hypothetical protein